MPSPSKLPLHEKIKKFNRFQNKGSKTQTQQTQEILPTSNITNIEKTKPAVTNDNTKNYNKMKVYKKKELPKIQTKIINTQTQQQNQQQQTTTTTTTAVSKNSKQNQQQDDDCSPPSLISAGVIGKRGGGGGGGSGDGGGRSGGGGLGSPVTPPPNLNTQLSLDRQISNDIYLYETNHENHNKNKQIYKMELTSNVNITNDSENMTKSK